MMMVTSFGMRDDERLRRADLDSVGRQRADAPKENIPLSCHSFHFNHVRASNS
jgi:hypothetical protein